VTPDELWDRLRARAIEIHDEGNLQRRLRAGERLRVKLGLDPTAPDIHVGHLVVLDMLRAFQDAGHTAVLIVGDFTALIGDPSGRSETRPVLSREQVDANAKTYFAQAYKVLDPELVEVRGNSEWLGGMTMVDVIRLLGTATLQQVLQREDFASRLRGGHAIGAQEILYPFNQAYDSVAIKADVEIGGTDQLFNLLFGREVQRAYGLPPQDVAVFPLLEGLDGTQKMSKSLNNYIGIAEPPEEIYGKVMSLPDAMTPKYARLLLDLDEAALPVHPRDAKAEVARRLVERLHGPAAAARAEADFDSKFRKRETPSEIEERTVSSAELVAAMVELGLAASRGAARRLAEQGGVRVAGEKVGADARLQNGDVLQVGRRRFVRIHLG